MFNKINLLTIWVFLTIAWTYDYQVEQRDEEIFLPCPDYPDNFIDKFATMPHNITVLSNDTYYVAGDIKVLYDFNPLKQYPTSVEFFKRERGNWQKTVYSMKREDFCMSLFNPSEIWSNVVSNIPAEQRICPLKKGLIFSVDSTMEPSFQMPSGSLEGEYWAHFEAGDSKNLKEFCCLDIYFSAFRI